MAPEDGEEPSEDSQRPCEMGWEWKEASWSFVRPTLSYNRQDWVPYGAPAAATPLSLTSAWGPGLAGLAPPSLSSPGVRTEGTAATGASEELSSLLPHVRPRRGMSPFLAGILESSRGRVEQQPRPHGLPRPWSVRATRARLEEGRSRVAVPRAEGRGHQQPLGIIRGPHLSPVPPWDEPPGPMRASLSD